MKVLFFYQHFWPDSPPYANMLRSIGTQLVRSGHEVSLITAEPSYKEGNRRQRCKLVESVDGIQVKRLRLLPGSRSLGIIRSISKALWPLRAMLSILVSAAIGKKPDVIIAATIPPVINGFCGLLAAKICGAKFVYHLQDIYPEIGAVGGLWSEDSLRHRVLHRLDTYICKRAYRCVVLSEDMRNALIARGVNSGSIATINNFMLSAFDKNNVQNTIEINHGIAHSNKYQIVFAGNLGRFQGLEQMLSAFLSLDGKATNLELHFIGEGAVAAELQLMSKDVSNVFFHGHHDYAIACQLMDSCDAGIVSIEPNVYKYAYPSKTLTYLGLGMPVLALVETHSELAVEIKKNQLGASASQNSKKEIVGGFLALLEFLKSDANDRNRIKLISLDRHSRDAVLPLWSELVKDVQESSQDADRAVV